MSETDETPRKTSYTAEQTSEKGLRRVEVVWAYLRDKWGDSPPQCPYCKTSSWSVDPVPVVLQRVGAPNPGFGAPMFIVFCENCANSVFIPVDALGGDIWDDLAEIEPSELGLTEEEYDQLSLFRRKA